MTTRPTGDDSSQDAIEPTIDVDPDAMFTAAAGRPGATEPVIDDAPVTVEGVSVYPDDLDAADLTSTAAAPVWGTPRLPPPGGETIERRPSRARPRPDEHGYYPDDYYLPTDWPRFLTKLVVGAILIAVLAVAGLELYDRFAPGNEPDDVAEATPTPRPEVDVYQCAGDPDPVAQMTPPGSLLIAGRTADSRWLAFSNPEAPPLQLWVPASDVPTFVPSTVGVVSCASAPDEFPTPR